MESVEDCIEKCCGEKTCEVAFLVDNKCHSVECYGDELCQTLPVEDETFSPTVVFINKRNGNRMKDRGKAGKTDLIDSENYHVIRHLYIRPGNGMIPFLCCLLVQARAVPNVCQEFVQQKTSVRVIEDLKDQTATILLL